MAMDRADEIRQTVREYYAGRASGGSCCAGATCCGGAEGSEDLLGPSLGCGTPLGAAEVQLGETVVDLGSGAGGDVLRAAQQVGGRGRAIGVDMTPEMVWKARENARRNSAVNTEFYLGEIEHLPLADGSADVVISNCVINLAPDKSAVFAEAFRVLRPGGRLIVADMVSQGPLPDAIRADPAAWAACISGAAEVTEYLATIGRAGFERAQTVASTPSSPGQVFSVTVRAIKPSA
ncbi:MAG: hypothetical protein AUH31_08035 [Armatimonadetes bacterium 13_1_40CM_64_14]|nr:MAG: hypothetical protein AUH31_08035 [Armatimonadetes bacterium 13_1_40CM_64_14]